MIKHSLSQARVWGNEEAEEEQCLAAGEPAAHAHTCKQLTNSSKDALMADAVT